VSAPFIVFEGPEGAGKSEQIARVAARLEADGRPFVRTREPGGTPIGEAIRDHLLRPGIEVPPITELLLFAAQRSAHVELLIRPALADGRLVLSDRFALSTRVYQGIARGLDPALIDETTRIATRGLEPDLYLILDVPPDVGRARQDATGARPDRIEEEDGDFMTRVREGYREYAAGHPNACLIDASGDAQTVGAAVWRELATRFPGWFA
jgi:dTMP kinase